MEIILSPQAQSDIIYWKSSGQRLVLKRIEVLLLSIQQDAFKGIGKPEILKYQLVGHWSRRTNAQHRIIYEIKSNAVHILSLRGHYL
ncbi:MAG: Txe/YoeB family addiction module toxin [Cytophagaceae bacterium]|nr:Txe/YoeB family addiction module toxin [Cytophagaceae bacterium]MBP6093685.1 Txe/YoeB family addiction module toxin [Cytophagaceae bacterium]